MLACVSGCAHVCERAYQNGKKICQVLNNGLACVKMNTVIGINDLMGALSRHNELEKAYCR